MEGRAKKEKKEEIRRRGTYIRIKKKNKIMML